MTTITNSAEEKRQSPRQTVGDRMKAFEETTAYRIDASLPFIIRLDGHSFSKFTSRLTKPFDSRMHEAMLRTSIDLLQTFRPTTVYTCSDEITLLFPAPEPSANDNEEPLMYNGKVQKLASLSAAYASTSFFHYITTAVQSRASSGDAGSVSAVEAEAAAASSSGDDSELLQYIIEKRPHFDARIFNVPSNSELVNNVVWRNHFDYRRNAVSILGRFLLVGDGKGTVKSLHGLNSTQILEQLAARGVQWDQLPAWYRFGTFIKHEKYETFIDAAEIRLRQSASKKKKKAQSDDTASDRLETPTNAVGDEAPVRVMRTRPVTLHFDMSGYSDDNLEFVCSKFYSGSLPSQPPTKTATDSQTDN